MTTATKVEILGADGRPYRETMAEQERERERALVARSVFAAANTYVQGLANIRLPAIRRAEDPLSNHAWVFAAAMLLANVQGQAPLTIVRETPEAREHRRRVARSRGRTIHPPRAGNERRSLQRYQRLRTIDRAYTRSYEPDEDHPAAQLLERPNPYQDGSQLMAYSILWYVVRGEIFWLKMMDDGSPVPPGEMPHWLLPIGPDFFEPILANRNSGELVGWFFKPPKWVPGARPGSRIALDLDQVIQFKSANPNDPLRGMSRITAVAQQVEQDILSRAHTSSLLKNQAVPKSLIMHETDLTKDEEGKFLERWKEKHEGVDNAGRTAMLTGGFKYQVLGLSPLDMQFLERELRNREEVLGVMGTPPSVVGLPNELNYATQQGQDKNFWDKTEIPMLCVFERGIDRGLLFETPDDVFAIFDLRNVEAMRAGLRDKVEIAQTLAGDKLHVPPRVAFNVVDLPVDEYPGDDVALVAGLSVPVQSAIDGALEIEPPPADVDDEVDPDDEEEEDPPEELGDEEREQAAARRAPAVRGGKSSAASRRKRWKQFVKLEIVLENAARRAYRAWISKSRAATLERFDAAASSSKSASVRRAIDLSNVVPDLVDLQKWLKGGVRPTYAATLDEVFSFTSEEIGVPIFSIDDGLLMQSLDLREDAMLAAAPKTMFKNVRDTLLAGVKKGETIAQLRVRIGETFKISASSAKTLTWARTEVGGLMSEVRTTMFDLQGVENAYWTDAGDEGVRPDHQLFGKAGLKPRGFNYLDLIDSGGGTLEYPGDFRAPAKQIVNCRCMESPE